MLAGLEGLADLLKKSRGSELPVHHGAFGVKG